MGNAKRRISAKRKRQFCGNESTNEKNSKNCSSTSTNASSSKIKMPVVFDKEKAEYKSEPLTGFSSSKKTLSCPEVNTRFFYGMRQIGKSFSAGFKCGALNVPRLSKTVYTNLENQLMSVISEVSELSMEKAASELLELHPSKNKIVECGFSVDGTWQRRGYTSMNECVAALCQLTLDIGIMSSYCPTCRKISKIPKSIESETFAAVTCAIAIFKVLR
ncbi:uncharacterized protein TNCV_1744611 [Trichonephila clavipes]|nr:uncharacterized protein TNCV_1744611 [Trichonephila clavipes]